MQCRSCRTPRFGARPALRLLPLHRPGAITVAVGGARRPRRGPNPGVDARPVELRRCHLRGPGYGQQSGQTGVSVAGHTNTSDIQRNWPSVAASPGGL